MLRLNIPGRGFIFGTSLALRSHFPTISPQLISQKFIVIFIYYKTVIERKPHQLGTQTKEITWKINYRTVGSMLIR